MQVEHRPSLEAPEMELSLKTQGAKQNKRDWKEEERGSCEPGTW